MENGIKLKTYYNRLKILREEALDCVETGNAIVTSGLNGNGERHPSGSVVMAAPLVNRASNRVKAPVFAALPMPQSMGVAIKVQLGEYVVGIQNGADDAMVERVLRAVARL